MTLSNHVKRLTVLVTAALVLAGPTSAAAQNAAELSDLSLEDLMNVRVERVFGASRRVQLTTEAPSSVTIITAEDISRHGYRTLADILRGVRGLYVTEDRNYSYLGARGFGRPGDYNTRVLLVVDGHRINDAIFDQAPLGRELGLDPASFQRVEVIRGPASALYGTSAFFAVVNITTKRGSDINGISIRGGIGSLGRSKIGGLAGRTFANGVDLAVGAGVENVDGYDRLYFSEFDDPSTNNGIAEDIDRDSLRTLSGRVSYRDLTVTGAFGHRTKTVPTAAFSTAFNDDRFTTADVRAFVDASLERTWRSTRYSLRAYADTYRYDGSYPFPAETPGGPNYLSSDYGYGTWWGAEARAIRQVAGRHTLTAGVELRDYAEQAQGEASADYPSDDWDIDVSTHVYAAYVQDELRLLDKWLLSVGGRYDAYSGFDRFSPRASVVFVATPTRAFKYLFGSAFRAPNAYELDYQTQGVRNTALRSETIATHEFVWEQYRGDWLRTTVSAYRSGVDRLIEDSVNEEDEASFANQGRVLARGVELEAEVRTFDVQVLASYAVQRARDRDTELELTNSPRHLGKLRFSIPGVVDGSTFSAEVQAISRRMTAARTFVEGHMVANVNYVHPLTPRLALTATVRNLFNAHYDDPVSASHRQRAVLQDGRTGYLGVRWNWTR